MCEVGALIHPDVRAVDALARLQLTAKRLGYRLELMDACEELQDLLHLTGLGEVFARLTLEPRGQPEEWEQRPGVEEEGDPADPIP